MTPNANGWREYRRLIRQEKLTPPEAYDRVLSKPEYQYTRGKK